MTVSREDLDAGRVDFGDLVAGSRALSPVHPGEVLGEWLEDFELSCRGLATALGVPHNHISAIVAGERGITADTALRLARYFGSAPEFWLNLQARYDLETERQAHGLEIEATVLPRASIAA